MNSFRTIASHALFKATLVLPLVGCSLSSEDSAATANESMPTTTEAPAEFVNAKGQVFVRKEKLQPGKFKPNQKGEATSTNDTRPIVDIASLSDAVLAKALRPKMAWAGYEYVAKDDAFALVQEIRRNKAAAVGTSGFNPSGEDDVAADELHGKTVIDTDDLYVMRNNTTYPSSAIAYLEAPEGKCTGTFIGPSTLLTSAHCVNDGVNWILPTCYPGADGGDDNPYPYGGFGCYVVTVPDAWDSNRPVSYDYAVIEFSHCGVYPGNTVGYLGVFATNTESHVEGIISFLFGYPADGRWVYPQLWGMSLPGVDAAAPRLIHTFDTYSGMSGGPVYQKRTESPCTGRCIVGVHHGPYQWVYTNQATWVVPNIWFFIQANSAL